MRRLGRWLWLMHRHELDRSPGSYRVLDLFRTDVAQCPIKPDAGQGAHQFKARESMSAGFGFAALEQSLSDTPTRVVGVDEKSTNLGCVRCGIQFLPVAFGVCITAEQSPPTTPAATTNQSAVAFDDKISAVIDQLGIDPESTSQCPFDLLRPIVLAAQFAGRASDQDLESRPVSMNRFA